MLANPAMFAIEGDLASDQAQCAFDKLGTIKKSEFALKHAINDTDWSPPGYILDGLRWLARDDIPKAEAAIDDSVTVDETLDAIAAHDD